MKSINYLILGASLGLLSIFLIPISIVATCILCIIGLICMVYAVHKLGKEL